MANPRFLINLTPASPSAPVALCSLCLLIAAGAAVAEPSSRPPVNSIATLPIVNSATSADAPGLLPSTARVTAAKSVVAKSVVARSEADKPVASKPVATKSIAAKIAPDKAGKGRTSTTGNAATSRVAARRGGTPPSLHPEKPATRFALTSPRANQIIPPSKTPSSLRRSIPSKTLVEPEATAPDSSPKPLRAQQAASSSEVVKVWQSGTKIEVARKNYYQATPPSPGPRAATGESSDDRPTTAQPGETASLDADANSRRPNLGNVASGSMARVEMASATPTGDDDLEPVTATVQTPVPTVGNQPDASIPDTNVPDASAPDESAPAENANVENAGTENTNAENAAATPSSPTPNSSPATVATPASPAADQLETLRDGPLSATIGAAPPTGPQSSRLYAPRISYDRGTIIAEGDPDNPVRLESKDARIIAQKVVLDTVNKIVRAEGSVRVEREITAERFRTLRSAGVAGPKYDRETITETLQGENFEYNYATKQGRLDTTRVRLENFNITAEQLLINGRRYIARNVIIRPGGLSDEEIEIYGTPPFSLRADELIVDNTRPAPPQDTVSDTPENDQTSIQPGPFTQVKGAWLYYKNLRLLPVPSALLRRRGGVRQQSTYQITPRIYFNSADGLLVTARLEYPLTPLKRNQLDLYADVGVSTKVGFRGGLELESKSQFGVLSLGARINDVISSDLTNRIELDRLPEIQYRPPQLKLFDLPGNRAAGFQFGFVAGDYRESFTDEDRRVRDSRLQAQVRFTTRLADETGPYLDLFARASRYGDHDDHFNTAGFEIGYAGQITKRLNGQFSFTAQKISGSTPFEFDDVDIRRELRATFDFLLTPRYIIPVDLRYDLDRKSFRDKTFGILRNYKTFAYGITYQTSRREIRLELRQGF